MLGGESRSPPLLNTTRRLVGSCRKLKKLSRLPTSTRQRLLRIIAYFYGEPNEMALALRDACHE